MQGDDRTMISAASTATYPNGSPGTPARFDPVFVPTIRIGFAGHMKYLDGQVASPLDRAFALIEKAIANCGVSEVRAATDGIEITTPMSAVNARQ